MHYRGNERKFQQAGKKQYWKCLRKMESPTDNRTYVPDEVMIDHFRHILCDDNYEIPNITTSHKKGKLDQDKT